MATYQCPKGHASTDPNYCSECGARIGAPPIAEATPAAQASLVSAEICPKCQTPRTPGARYCEVCRYDFESGSSSGQAQATQAEAVATSAPITTSPADQANAAVGSAGSAPSAVSAAPGVTAGSSAPTSTAAQRLNIVVITDPSLTDDEEMRKKCPPNAPELVFPLDLDETLVGRRSDNRRIFPEIDLDDPGVSHRQLKLLRQPDGSFAALELGSANGTTLNGVPLKPGLLTPVTAGDELIVGMWTRLQLRPR